MEMVGRTVWLLQTDGSTITFAYDAAGKIHKEVKFDKLSTTPKESNKPSILKNKKGHDKIEPEPIEERDDNKGHPSSATK